MWTADSFGVWARVAGGIVASLLDRFSAWRGERRRAAATAAAERYGKIRLVKLGQENVTSAEDVDARTREARRKRLAVSTPAAIPAFFNTAPEPKDADHELTDKYLSHLFGQMQSGEIVRADYRKAVEVAAAAGAKDDTDWRLQWLDRQDWNDSISRADIPAKGKWARFDYVDTDGVATKRSITMWEKRGAYIVGYDRSRKDERTFRQDRINDWLCG